MILGLILSVGAMQAMTVKTDVADLEPKQEITPIVVEIPEIEFEDDETVEIPEIKRPIKLEPIEAEPFWGIGEPGSPTNPIPVPKPVKPKLEVM